MTKPDILPRIYNILLVDDNDDHLFVLKNYLKNIPCSIEIANNGLSAIDKVKSSRYDLILMDMKMPEMGGCEAIKLIREWEDINNLPPTPIVGVSAYAFKEDIAKGLDEGCTLYLVKPIRKSTFLNALSEAIPLFEV